MMQDEYFETSLGKFMATYRSGSPLVVMLSGMGQFDTAETFSNVTDLLPENYGVLALDYLNSGKSGLATRDYTVYDEAEELAKIINDKKAPLVTLVGHSIAGIYALLLAKKINNLVGFVGIEPTTREVINHAPRTPEYLEAEKMDASFTQEQFEKWLDDNLQKDFAPRQVAQIWQTYRESVARLTEADAERIQKNLQSMPLSDDNSNLRLPADLPSISICESYREAEYLRSEFMTPHPRSCVLTGGTFHYIHWEHPEFVIRAIQHILGK